LPDSTQLRILHNLAVRGYAISRSAGEQSGLLTRIAATEAVRCTRGRKADGVGIVCVSSASLKRI
jgi:hypothetical protein